MRICPSLDRSKIYLRCIYDKVLVQLFAGPLIAKPMADLFTDEPPPDAVRHEPAADAPLADRTRSSARNI
jgi:hypothetical protein